MCLLAFCRSSLFCFKVIKGIQHHINKLVLNNRKRTADKRKMEHWSHSYTTIGLRYSAAALAARHSVMERRRGEERGYGSVVFRADFNGWAGEQSSGDIRVITPGWILYYIKIIARMLSSRFGMVVLSPVLTLIYIWCFSKWTTILAALSVSIRSTVKLKTVWHFCHDLLFEDFFLQEISEIAYNLWSQQYLRHR